MYKQAKQAFEKYIDNYDRNDKNIHLKYMHTYQVVELMAELAFRLGLDKEDIELAKVIGLLHDIGRFEQIKELGMIPDQEISTDHAEESCIYLLNQGHIRDFIEDSKFDSIIEKAIRNHNKFEIEKGLEEKELLFSKMIRDMDKVDIFRVLAVEYEQKFKASELSESILKEFSQEKAIIRNLAKTESDMILLRVAFIFDINFNESFDILVETDNFDLFLGTVEVSKDSEKLWKKIREISFDKINRGIGDEYDND